MVISSRLRLVAISVALTLARCGPEPLALVLASQASPAWVFATAASSRYTAFVAATTATRGESRIDIGGRSATWRIFCVRCRRTPSMGGSGGGLRAAGSYVPVSQPAVCCPPRLRAGSSANADIGGRTMRQSSLAHTGQLPLPEILAIVRTALRDAVSASTDRESLDVAGAALVAVAERVRAMQGEVRHV